MSERSYFSVCFSARVVSCELHNSCHGEASACRLGVRPCRLHIRGRFRGQRTRTNGTCQTALMKFAGTELGGVSLESRKLTRRARSCFGAYCLQGRMSRYVKLKVYRYIRDDAGQISYICQV